LLLFDHVAWVPIGRFQDSSDRARPEKRPSPL